MARSNWGRPPENSIMGRAIRKRDRKRLALIARNRREFYQESHAYERSLMRGTG